jgi:hypothetical protein
LVVGALNCIARLANARVRDGDCVLISASCHLTMSISWQLLSCGLENLAADGGKTEHTPADFAIRANGNVTVGSPKPS